MGNSTYHDLLDKQKDGWVFLFVIVVWWVGFVCGFFGCLVLFYHDSEIYLTIKEVLQCWLHSAIANYTLESDVRAINKF